MNNDVIYVLLAVSIISIVISVVSLVLILKVLKRQDELVKICKTRPMESQTPSARVMNDNRDNMAQGSNQDVRKQGIIICKRCYAPISETSVVCPICKTSVGRR